MIFFGNGSLLRNAITDVLSCGNRIDYVISQSEELLQFCNNSNIKFKKTSNVNLEKKLLVGESSDGLVFSINNGQIFDSDMLALDSFKFYNIHNGLIPKYRGLPEVCIFFAILNGEKEYGVSLHEIDAGIDTGPCLAQLRFKIRETDTFQDVMLNGINHCQKIFQNNLDKILKSQLKEICVDRSDSHSYSYKDFYHVDSYKNNKNLPNAMKFGVFKLYFNKAYSILAKELSLIKNK